MPETQLSNVIDTGDEPGQLYTPWMLADLVGLPVATIHRWQRRGLIQPVRLFKQLPYFDFQEVATARRIARLMSQDPSPQQIESKLARLAALYPDLPRPIGQLSFIVEGRNLLLRSDDGLIEPGGQKRMDFADIESDSELSADEEPVSIRLDDHLGYAGALEKESEALSIRDCRHFTTPEEFIELANYFEDRLEVDLAIDVYRSMCLEIGPSAEICFRIAEMLYQQSDLQGARERYYMAIELDDTLVEARASLGCVLMELNQYELAYSAFAGALTHHADYPDVHFHLARLLDEMDRSLEAEYHWNYFLNLAPQSPWAEEARERLRRE